MKVLNKEIRDEARRRMEEGAMDSGDVWVRINSQSLAAGKLGTLGLKKFRPGKLQVEKFRLKIFVSTFSLN